MQRKEFEEMRKQAAARGWEIEPSEVWHGNNPVYGMYNLSRVGTNIGPLWPAEIPKYWDR
ncbi:MAG TPA: hypothetical protein VGG75_38650 [Trebonia sp.]|jgi:hypothetical protein